MGHYFHTAITAFSKGFIQVVRRQRRFWFFGVHTSGCYCSPDCKFFVEKFSLGNTIKETHKFEMLEFSFAWNGNVSVDDFCN